MSMEYGKVRFGVLGFWILLSSSVAKANKSYAPSLGFVLFL